MYIHIPFLESASINENSSNETPPESYTNFAWNGIEVTIIILSFIAILINIAVFFSLKMYRVCSSAMLITLMTIILAMRVATEALKIVDDESNIVGDFLLHLRVTHDISTYFFAIVLVILFFQWGQTYRLLVSPLDAANILLSRRFFWLQFAFGVVSAIIIGLKIWVVCQDSYA